MLVTTQHVDKERRFKMSDEGNRIKNRLLGMPHGTASNRLRKTILYSMLYGKVYDRHCFHCGREIEHVDEMSIEHKQPWQSANDPKAVFFDLENIAFSHLRCNTMHNGSSKKTECPHGHPYTDENTHRSSDGDRHCRPCNTENKRKSRGEMADTQG